MKKIRFFQIDSEMVRTGIFIALLLFSYYLYGIFTERTTETQIAGIVFFLLNAGFYFYLLIFRYFVSWGKNWMTIKIGSRKGTSIKRENITGYEVKHDQLVVRVGEEAHTWNISQVDPRSLEKLNAILDSSIINLN